MSRDLFGTVTDPPAHIGGRSGLTLSLAAHAVALMAIVVVPLIATDVLPVPSQVLTVIMPGAHLPPEPPRPVPPARRPEAATLAAAIPLDAPRSIVPERPLVPPVDLGEVVPGAIGPTAVGGGDGRATTLTPPPPPPPPPPQPPVQPPVHVGGTVTAPAKVFDLAPVYPVIARSAGVEGVVILQATIGLDGHVEDLQVLRSVPLLDEAATTAVRQWRYTPTRLNGQPVAVVMTVTVSFRLR